MMVETILESSQDFGMSGGALPQWKRELLQRRAAKARPAAPPQPPPPPPPPPPDDDEELRYGPGIVKRLKSRYLSLALRDQPRRRPSVLRRATSLEHLLDAPAPPPPRADSRPPRPASVAAPPPASAFSARRESVKRARSVDALSRLDTRDDPRAPSPSPPPPAPRLPPTSGRAARPPRRPTPLLRETERPPPDVVRSTLRKFEPRETKRVAPAARVSAVLRGLEGARAATPEPAEGAESRDSSPPPPLPSSPAPTSRSSPVPPLLTSPVPPLPTSPVPPLPANPAPVSPAPAPTPTPTPTLSPAASFSPASMSEGGAGRVVSRAALEEIARAGVSVRYAFPGARGGSHLPPLSATNTVLVGRARRVGVIRPMPARVDPERRPDPADPVQEKITEEPRLASPVPPPPAETENVSRVERREAPPSALVEPQPRVPVVSPTPPPAPAERTPSPEPKGASKPAAVSTPLMNGHGGKERAAPTESPVSRICAAGVERAWSGSGERRAPQLNGTCAGAGVGVGGGVRRGRGAPPPAATSVVFNFSARKEVPDYIENDGIILRNKTRFKPGEAGIVVLRPEALQCDSDSDCEPDGGPPSPCAVRFVNDNVLINGKSSMATGPTPSNRDRIAKLKLQFDESLTRTHEYPSETSLSEESPAPQPAQAQHHAPLAHNTHIASAALSRYTPSKTVAASFQLGVTRCDTYTDVEKISSPVESPNSEIEPTQACGADARSWSEARTHATDLLF